MYVLIWNANCNENRVWLLIGILWAHSYRIFNDLYNLSLQNSARLLVGHSLNKGFPALFLLAFVCLTIESLSRFHF